MEHQYGQVVSGLPEAAVATQQEGDGSVPRTGLKWVNVAGLGVAFAVSGNFSGWNMGLGIGGWGGMLLAALLMACFYLCLVQCVAELAAACPVEADGMDSFAAIGLGNGGRFFAGISIAMAVSMCVGVGASFIQAYCLSVFGVGGSLFKIALIAAFVLFQLRGAREAVFLTTVGGFFSVAVLVFFCAAMVPGFSLAALYSHHDGVATLLPNGIRGALECIPYALFMFLGVEQAANAAGDMHEPSKHLPKAIFAAVGTVVTIGISVLIFAAGGGVERVAAADGNPLFVAVAGAKFAGATGGIETAVGIGSIVSLLSTAFSLVYAASRQFFSLAKGGFLHGGLARLNKRDVPSNALWLVAALAVLGAQMDADTVLVCFIFCLNICNLLVLLSFLRARAAQPGLARPYRAIGGRVSAGIAGVLALAVMAACVQLQPAALEYVALGYGLCAVYYLVRRPRLRSAQ
ncbi:APC family permease [Ralstonia soli]|uniref:APC family permease n=1 Tax=Ralstonia soli TaxID=2953896 RepID=A0ABT1AH18_9RALS|nr:APC family permease [Ralstonia soli]MCO5397614.1 APC family permease [Ralstonia soli]